MGGEIHLTILGYSNSEKQDTNTMCIYNSLTLNIYLTYDVRSNEMHLRQMEKLLLV